MKSTVKVGIRVKKVTGKRNKVREGKELKTERQEHV